MKKRIKLLCLAMVLIVTVNSMPFPVWAVEDVLRESVQAIGESGISQDVFLAESNSEEETLPPEILPGETVPEETVAEETVPEETVAEETVPEETVPEESVPGETEEEQREEAEENDILKYTKGIPLFFQNDYPDVRYGYGSIASSGCSVTCLAMVANYLTGHPYTPEELAGYIGWRGQNNMERMERGSELLKLPYSKNTNWHVTEKAIRDGKIAIVLVNSRSPFTSSQHFILITGVSDEGRYFVHDPNRNNYTKWDLKNGFANGFTAQTIISGFEGAWVYSKAYMPKEPYIYQEEVSDIEPRYPGIKLTLAEEDLLAKVVWVEARGESLDGQQAVAEVALNRLVSGDFPDTLHDVIYGEGQFRSVPFLDDADPNHTQYEAIRRALYGPYILPMDVYYFATYPINDNIWGTIGGHIFCRQYE